MTPERLNHCRMAFEQFAQKTGERAKLGDDGDYASVVHRVRWKHWIAAWESCLDHEQIVQTVAIEGPVTPLRVPVDDSADGLHVFLQGCRMSGVFFDGMDAVGNDGVYFVDGKLLNSLGHRFNRR